MSVTPWLRRQYPSARRSGHVDVYKSEARGEVAVHDPYQWMEFNGEETDRWTTDQEIFTRSYLDKYPYKQKLQDQIRRNIDYAKSSAPSFKHDKRWYWYYNSGLQAQAVFCRSVDEKLPQVNPDTGVIPGEIFFDSNLLADDGTASIVTSAFSRCGKYYAYALSYSGSDSCTIYVRPTGAPLVVGPDGRRPTHHEGRLKDEIRHVKFSGITWTHDSLGFFYQRFPNEEINGFHNSDTIDTQDDQNAMLYYHRVGTSQSEDILVMKDEKHPRWQWYTDVTDMDGKYLLLNIVQDTSRKNMLWIADLENDEIGPNMKWDKLIDSFEAEFDYVANDGSKFYFQTNEDAPQVKVIAIDLADEKRERVDIVPEDKDAHLDNVTAVNGRNLVITYKRNVKDEVYIYSMNGERLRQLVPDFVGSVAVNCYRHQPWLFVTMIGFTNPGIIGKYDFSESKEDGEGQWSIYRATRISGLNPDDFSAQQVWYESKDGTKVPMFIVKHKDTIFDGTAPAIQYGYGGFSIPVNPFFSPSMLTFLQKYGAVLAVPNIRGGGEFGEDWHLAGTRERKVNSIDDFIAATQFLVKNKYAARGKVAINGGSNGGMLVAACVNRAPEGTFGAAIAEVGVMDLLKFANFTIGKAWTSDYGDPSDPHDFDFIYPISPLHNIPTDRVLPPTMLLTADHDDRVVPMHSFKHAATLQYLHPHNPHPLLIRIDKKAGHGAGKATDQRIREAADKWGFVAQSLGLLWRDN